MYQFSKNGALFLEKWEGFVDHVYQHAGDVPTIGIGTTFYPGGRKVRFGDPSITHDEALADAQWYMNTLVIPILTQHVKVPLNQDQIDALCSFTYNEGIGSFVGSHLLIAINSNAGKDAITAEFNKWIYVNHEVSDWQVKRRAGEASLYFS
jgi:lysozyme